MNFVSHLVAHLRVAAVAGAIAVAAFAAPRKVSAPPTPAVRIDLTPFGYRAISDHVAQSDMSVMSVNFAGPDHLLVTFVSRKLIPRDPDQRETDRDRLIHALLLELPSGKAVAETDWRFHDAGRYLWPLADNRFLVRSRDRLYLVSPLAANPGEELTMMPIVKLNRDGVRLRSINITSDGRYATIQTDAAPQIGDDPDMPRSTQVDFRFYEIRNGNFMELGHTSLAHSVAPAFNQQGFLESTEDKPPFWGFDLHGFQGGTKELAAVESSCRPLASFVSPGEFLIAACRGGDIRSMMGVLNVSGEVLWLGPGAAQTWPAVSSAPAAERIAIRGTLSDASGFADASVVVGLRGQEITVYRTYTGDPLLTVPVRPAVQAPQNFAISNDGLKLVVWQDGAVEVYTLPPVTPKDLEVAKKSAQQVQLKQAATAR